jgi:hypothetical protein
MVDSLIYKLAVSTGRIILTSNVKDFRPLMQEDFPASLLHFGLSSLVSLKPVKSTK